MDFVDDQRLQVVIMQHQEQTRFQQAQLAAAACERLLKERYGVRQVYLFGSLAGQSPWHSRSDIDLAVEGLPPDKYFRALSELWDLLPEGMNLDLVPLEDAPPALAARIKGEVKMPDDPMAALTIEIESEFASLKRVVDQATELLQLAPEHPGTLEINAGGKLVHDFYNGVERIFERIAQRLGPGLPLEGPSWHTVLLRSMEVAAEEIRPAVVDHALALRLLEYLQFRHLFSHSYGYELQWARLRPLIDGLEETFKMLREELNEFIEVLKQASKET